MRSPSRPTFAERFAGFAGAKGFLDSDKWSVPARQLRIIADPE